MKKYYKPIFTLLAFLFLYTATNAQITINGPRFRSRYYEPPRNGLSISYGKIIWTDLDPSPVEGYSSSLALVHAFGIALIDSVESLNGAYAFNFGYDRDISRRFVLKTRFSTGKLTTGAAGRPDLIVTDDKSRIMQIGLYGSYSLTKKLDRRIQFQLLLGPELIYAKRDFIIDEYVVEPTDTPGTYHYKQSVLQGAVVGGLGVSIHVLDNLTFFSDYKRGFEFPGFGKKVSSSWFGLRGNF